jgi:hypothetical protein
VKKILLGVLFLPVLALAQVKVEKTVICGTTTEVFESVTKEWKESPVWTSRLDDSRIVLTINETTKTWSIIQYNENIACVIEAGEKYQFLYEKF